MGDMAILMEAPDSLTVLAKIQTLCACRMGLPADIQASEHLTSSGHARAAANE